MKLARLSILVAATALAMAAVAADKVWISKSGEKYHFHKTCPTLKGAKEIKQVTMTEVRKKKITMCKLCADSRKPSKPTPPRGKKAPAPPTKSKGG